MKQIIKCDVENCKHCDCDKKCCKLEEIKVCNCECEKACSEEQTMCADYKKKD